MPWFLRKNLEKRRIVACVWAYMLQFRQIIWPRVSFFKGLVYNKTVVMPPGAWDRPGRARKGESVSLEKFVINGGKPLTGEVSISGAKNAAVAILPATILAADKCIIENLPDISDVAVSLQILSALGAQIRMLTKNSYEIDTSHITATQVPDELSRQMRASYYFLGALLGRFGSGKVAMPGGCNLGPRPIDQHLKAFCALGAQDSVEYGMIEVA